MEAGVAYVHVVSVLVKGVWPLCVSLAKEGVASISLIAK